MIFVAHASPDHVSSSAAYLTTKDSGGEARSLLQTSGKCVPMNRSMDHYEFNKSRIIERDAALREQRYAFLSSLISVMEPSEVVGLYRRESEAQSRLADELFDTVGFLFEHDVPQACSIVSCMAESANSKDREDAAGTLDTLTPVASRLGFHLWDRLIRDEDPKVRERAYDLIKEYISESDEGSNSGPLVDKLRLTWQDAYQLVRGYSEAESGRNRHQVGSVAVSGAVDRPRNL